MTYLPQCAIFVLQERLVTEMSNTYLLFEVTDHGIKKRFFDNDQEFIDALESDGAFFLTEMQALFFAVEALSNRVIELEGK